MTNCPQPFKKRIPSLGSMPGDPHSRSKVWKALGREIGKPRENRGKVFAHGEFQPAAAFHDREYRRNGPASGLPMCNQFFRPRATGRIEFSARIVLSSNSGTSKKR